jgi:hypothetical protein
MLIGVLWLFKRFRPTHLRDDMLNMVQVIEIVRMKLKGQIPPDAIISYTSNLENGTTFVRLRVGIKTYSWACSQEQLEDSSPETFIDHVTTWIKGCIKMEQGGQAAPPPKPKDLTAAILETLKSDKTVNFGKMAQLIDMYSIKVVKLQEEAMANFKFNKEVEMGLNEAIKHLDMAKGQSPMTATQMLKQEESFKATHINQIKIDEIEKHYIDEIEKHYEEFMEGTIFPGKVYIDEAPANHEPISDLRIMQAVLVILLMTPHDMLPGDDEPLVITKKLVDNVLENLNVRITRDNQSYTIQIV